MQARGESSWGRVGTKEKLELFQYRDGDRDRDRDSSCNDIIQPGRHATPTDNEIDLTDILISDQIILINGGQWRCTALAIVLQLPSSQLSALLWFSLVLSQPNIKTTTMDLFPLPSADLISQFSFNQQNFIFSSKHVFFLFSFFLCLIIRGELGESQYLVLVKSQIVAAAINVIITITAPLKLTLMIICFSRIIKAKLSGKNVNSKYNKKWSYNNYWLSHQPLYEDWSIFLSWNVNKYSKHRKYKLYPEQPKQ